MGRHRRTGPAPTARRPRGAARVGLLGASAALAAGAVALGTAVLPGSADRPDSAAPDVQARESAASGASPDPSGTVERETGGPASRDGDRTAEPTDEERDTAADEPTDPAETDASPDAESPTPRAPETPAPETPDPGGADDGTETPGATGNSTPDATDEPAQQAADEVLRLVNQERAAAGCPALTADPALDSLAGDHSRAMAEQDFFAHESPDGSTPWDRAEAAGITDLGAENIARGQQSAQEVLDSWMASEGHRANILNCDFRTLGVGVHVAPGGPWWTQNFGY